MNILKWPIRNGRGSFHALIVNTDGGIGEVRGIVSLKKKKGILVVILCGWDLLMRQTLKRRT